jgi:hypothetical protein
MEILQILQGRQPQISCILIQEIRYAHIATSYRRSFRCLPSANLCQTVKCEKRGRFLVSPSFLEFLRRIVTLTLREFRGHAGRGSRRSQPRLRGSSRRAACLFRNGPGVLLPSLAASFNWSALHSRPGALLHHLFATI